MSGFSHILVPVDYSPPSAAALRLAGDMARACDAHVTVLHLIPIEVYAFADYPLVAPDDARLARERERLDGHVREVFGAAAPPFEVEVSWGSPFLQIVDHAIERKVDLIVMGTHGRTGLKHALLGSVAEKTVRLAPCPVLTTHDGATVERAARTTDGPAARHGRAVVSVGDVMSAGPVAARSTDSLELASARMLEAGARHLPVVDDDRLVGILSDRDIQPYVGHLPHTRVNAAMSPDPTTVTADVSVAEAARRMIDSRVRALPVVDGGRLTGIITSTDILEDYVLAARG